MVVRDLNHLEFLAPAGKRLVVLGDPIKHSLSPAMHNAALQEMSRNKPELAQWKYEAVHVPADKLDVALPKLHHAGVAGINLTIPHKVRALDIIDEVDTAARRMGAVNTLVRTADGYRGSNTDGYGILKAIQEAFDRTVKGADIWLFGAGGAARGILVACVESGARRLTIVNRSSERLDALHLDLSEQELPGFDRMRFFNSGEAPADVESGAILINATSLGLKATDPVSIADSFLQPGSFVYDTTYGTRNQLAIVCQQKGISYADGLSMLVWQGVRSLEIWTGEPVPADTMRTAAELELRKRKENG